MNLLFLDLSRNELIDDCMVLLERGLRRSTEMSQINLSYNSIGPAGAHALANVLRRNSFLHGLNLQSNMLGCRGATTIVQALQSDCKSLLALSLSDNRIGEDGAFAIVSSLRDAKNLMRLDLSRNELTDNSAKLFANAIADKNGFVKLSNLDLDQNLIGDVGAVALSSAILTMNIFPIVISDITEFDEDRMIEVSDESDRPQPVTGTVTVSDDDCVMVEEGPALSAAVIPSEGDADDASVVVPSEVGSDEIAPVSISRQANSNMIDEDSDSSPPILASEDEKGHDSAAPIDIPSEAVGDSVSVDLPPEEIDSTANNHDVIIIANTSSFRRPLGKQARLIALSVGANIGDDGTEALQVAAMMYQLSMLVVNGRLTTV